MQQPDQYLELPDLSTSHDSSRTFTGCLSIHLMFRKDDLGGPGIPRSRLQSSIKWSGVSSLETELDNRICHQDGI